MSKIIVGSLFFLFIVLNSFSAPASSNVMVEARLKSNDSEPNLILYQSVRKLFIKDFKGKSDRNSPGVAATYSGIKMEISSSQKGNEIKVAVGLTCYFDPNKSWMKKSGEHPWILNHEQKHFDLTYIQTCKLLTAIQGYSFTKNWHQELMSLRQQYLDELTALQNEYDKETIHGTKREIQEIFNIKIEKELIQTSCS